jgi:outer membrane immunogenic protein
MRLVICAVVGLMLLPSRALAGDYDVLRGSDEPVGPAPFTRWAGVYFGGQVGYTTSVATFSDAARNDLAFLLRDTAIEQDQNISSWPQLTNRHPASAAYGGFFGYNVQFEDLILGTEINYNRVSLTATSSDLVVRSFVDSTNLPTGHHYDYTVLASAQAALHMTDVGTFRLRAGWVLDCFLPYGFIGFAVGRTNVSNSGTIAYTAVDNPDTATPPLTPLPNLAFGPETQGNMQNGAFAYGFATGLGMDVAITSHVFLRGEFEFIYFGPVQGTQISMESARIGAGLKF